MLFTFLSTMLVATLGQVHITYGQAVDLIPIQSGNNTLDKGLPEFYDCIDEKIDASKGVGVDSYFEKEPTKHEVSTCYIEVFNQNTNSESTDSTNSESTDSTNSESTDDKVHSDIERFNSLFGVMG